jgi:hypothetical protein
MKRALLAVVLVAAAFTGCLGADDSTSPTPSDEAGTASTEDRASERSATTASEASGGTTDQSQALDVVTYPGLEETVVDHVRENGTYQAQEACMLGGCVTGDSTRSVDLPAPGPGELPIHVVVEMTAEGGTPYMWLDAGDGTVYSMDWERSDDGSEQRIEAVVLPGSETMQAMMQWFGFPPATEVDYTLEARLMAHHDIAFSGVAVEVPLEPGQRIQVDNARNEDPIQLVRYDPQDRETARHDPGTSTIETIVPEDAEAGDHVLLIPPGQPDVTIRTNGTSAEMEPVTYAREMGETREVPTGEPVEWQFELDRTPMAVGIYVEREAPTSWEAGETSARIDAPNGTVVDVQQSCSPFVCFSGGSFTSYYASQAADPNLADGTYTASYEQQVNTDVRVGHYSVTFDR